MSAALLGAAVLCCCSSSSVAGAFFGGFIPGTKKNESKKTRDTIDDIIKEIYSKGFSEEKCLKLSTNWKKLIDGRPLNEIFVGQGSSQSITDPEIAYLFSKHKRVIRSLISVQERRDFPDGVCISDLKNKIDERVTLLKNQDIQGCDLYDDYDSSHLIRKEWSSALIWDSEKDKVLPSYRYAQNALGETEENIKTHTTLRTTLCAPPPPPPPSQ
jgi:hypothetical protein